MEFFLLTQDAVPLYYFLMTLLLCAFTTYILLFKKTKKVVPLQNEKKVFITILTVGFILRVVLAPFFEGHSTDMGCFKAWSNMAANNFSSLYNAENFLDYPPGYVYVMLIMGKFINFFQVYKIDWLYTLIIKLPPMITDIVTGYVIYIIAKKYVLQPKLRLIIVAAYVFNPLVFFDSVIWGQVDSFFTLFIVLTFFFINKNKIIMASVFYMLSILIKPQGILFAPVFLLQLFLTNDMKAFIFSIFQGSSGKVKHTLNRLLKGDTFPNILWSILASFITAMLVISPFSIANGNITWIIKRYQITMGEYPFATLNAANIFAIFQKNWFKQDEFFFLGITHKNFGTASIFVLCLLVLFLYFKSSSPHLPYLTSALLITGIFCMANGMHERYMFPVIALILISFSLIHDKRLLVIFSFLTLNSFINVLQVYVLQVNIDKLKKSYWIPVDDMLFIWTGFLNLVIFIYFVKVSVDILIRNKTVEIKP